MSSNPAAIASSVIFKETASLAGEDIVCLTHTPWHGPWKASQQIMSLLAKSNRVLYVGPPRALGETVDRLRKGWVRRPVLDRLGDTLFVYQEPGMYTRANDARLWSRPFNWSTSRLRVAHVRRLAQRHHMHSPILWVFDPMMAFAVGAFREKLLIYHLLDNYVEFFPPAAVSLRASLAQNEATMLAKADLVFAVSESLHERAAKANPHSFLVPNGVDYDRFQRTIASRAVPSDLGLIPRPIVGYVGVIQPDLDFFLLERLSAECPDCSIVFVGPVELGTDQPRFQALLARLNVHYLGPKAVEDVPTYIHGCDVCIAPDDVENSKMRDCDSIKLYEYLASGRPIVATDTPSARRVRDFVRIARSHVEFIKYVRENVDGDGSGAGQRKAVAREQSWQRRVELLSVTIRRRLPAKIGAP